MQSVHKFVSKAHKWIGLLIAAQVLFWTGSGLFMSIVPIETVRSEHTIAETAPVTLDAGMLPAGIRFQKLEAVAPLGTPLVLVTDAGGAQFLLDPATGQQLPSFSAEEIISIARHAFRGEPGAPEAVLFDTEPGDYRGSLPVWQVSMGDEGGTRLYVDPASGRIKARRSDVWRVYDFLWMLHIMDYDTRDDFNHPLLMVAAGSAFLFTITGIVLLFYRFRRRDFGLKARRR